MTTIHRTMTTSTLLVLALATGGAACDDDVEPSETEEVTEGATENAAEAAQAEGESAVADTVGESDPVAEAAEAPATATVGEPAPAFTLTDQAGTEHTLGDLRGKIVVLEWINPQCPYVQRHYEAGTMTDLDGDLPDDEVVWLAVDSSHFVTAEDAQAWREENAMAYPILLDPEGEVGRAYEAKTTPHMFVIDAEGVLRYSGAIDDDPRGRDDLPTNYVDQAVQALRDGEEVPVSQTEPYGCTVKYENS